MVGDPISLNLGYFRVFILDKGSEASPQQAAGHPDKDGGTLHSH
jgi:hypothetical protein